MILGGVSLILLIGVGYCPARLLTGARFAALLVAPITTALLITVFGLLCLALGLSLIVGVACAVLVSAACAGALLLRGTLHIRRADDSAAILWLPLGGLIPLATVLRPPVAGDARSIWWFHAKWWAEGADALLDAMRNPAFNWSHSDYPPLAPATNGGLWVLLGSRSLKEAQLSTAVLGLSAVATLGFAFWRLFVGRLSLMVITASASLLIAALFGVASVGPATDGYVDFLWAAEFSAAAVFLLTSPRSDEALRWGALMLAAAALTKNEALIACLLVGGLSLVRYRFGGRASAWIAAGLTPGVLWIVSTRVLGVRADSWRIGALLRLDPVATHRIGHTLHAVGHELIYVALAAAVLTALGLRYASAARIEVSESIFPWIWAAWGLTVASLVFAYVASTDQLNWRLAYSVERTTIAPNFLLVTEAAIWTLALAVALKNAATKVTPSATTSAASAIAQGHSGSA